MIKKLIKNYIPVKYFTVIRQLINRLNFFSYLYYDYRHLFKLRKNKQVKISDIIRQYHRVEKSLTKVPYNPKRGHRAAYALLNFLEKYQIENKEKDVQFYVGLNALRQFFNNNKEIDSKAHDRLNKFIDIDFEVNSGVEVTPKSYFLENALKSFENLAKSRKSIRYFSDQKVDLILVEKALDIASKTPSVCNRQGWHTWIITEPKIISLFREVHNGFANENQKLTTLLVMTFDKNAFDYPMERNQGFTDAGLYSMSVMYSLTHVGLASCPLNSNLLLGDKKRLRKAIGLPDNYTIAMFIAVGNYLEENITPISFRYNAKQKSTLI
jgi:nitroreductase